jgi:hypothetical protein
VYRPLAGTGRHQAPRARAERPAFAAIDSVGYPYTTETRAVTWLLDVALAWMFLGAFGALARVPGRPARALLLAALRRASQPARPRSRGAGRRDDDVVAAFRSASAGHRLARSCVPRALALHRLLVWRGLPARLRLGLGPGRPLAGHAWVECDGEPVGEAPSAVARYRPCETS